MRVVIAHDFLETYGGAERVTQEMAAAFPDATVHAILGRPSVVERMGISDRFSSLLPARERLMRHYRLGTPLLPAVVDAARLPEADVLLTSSYAFAHRFRTRNDAPQVCFCHSPLRFAWSMTDSYRRELSRGRATSAAFRTLAATMRWADRAAARRPARFMTSCDHVADQIARFYDREAEVIGAPIDCELFRPAAAAPKGDYWLFVGRLIEPYKRAAMTVEAFRTLGERLVVVGDGPAMAQLRADKPPNVELLGALGDEALVELMQNCRAAVFPSKDDLGLLPLEVMACGRPVLAYGGGGALDTIRQGVTGAFFHEQSAEAIADAVRHFDPDAYDPVVLRQYACSWDKLAFRERLVSRVRDAAAA
jgi:glycosyltransferase involved in cell wall biosynthesis